MALMKRVTLTGLAVMATMALVTAIWPSVAGLVTGLLVAVLSAGTGTLVVLATRWVRGELAWRRELLTLPPVDAASYGAGAPAPALAFVELRESA